MGFSAMAGELACRDIRAKWASRPAVSIPTLSPEAPLQDRLLGVEAVLGFIENQRHGTINDSRIDLLPAMRRQAVEEQGLGLGMSHKVFADLERAEVFQALDGILVAHRDEGVGHDDVGPSDSFHRIAEEIDAALLGARPLDIFAAWIIAGRRGYAQRI